MDELSGSKGIFALSSFICFLLLTHVNASNDHRPAIITISTEKKSEGEVIQEIGERPLSSEPLLSEETAFRIVLKIFIG